MTTVQRNSVHYFQRPDAPSVRVDSNATSLTGTAARFTLAKQRGNTFVNSAFGIISPGFDVNDLGFRRAPGTSTCIWVEGEPGANPANISAMRKPAAQCSRTTIGTATSTGRVRSTSATCSSTTTTGSTGTSPTIPGRSTIAAPAAGR